MTRVRVLVRILAGIHGIRSFHGLGECRG
jgi:hypothetical protein